MFLRFSNFELFSIEIDRFIDFLIASDRPFETSSIFDETSNMGFSRALNRMAVLICLENRYLGSNRSIRLLRSDRF